MARYICKTALTILNFEGPERMSLMRTLAKVAVGVAIAKGAGAMMKNSGGAQSQNAGLGGLLGGLTGGGAAGGGLQGMLGSLTGGGASAAGGAGGLQDMLGGLLGGAQGGGASGGLAGGLGGLLENLGGGSAGGAGGAFRACLGVWPVLRVQVACWPALAARLPVALPRTTQVLARC